MQRHCKITVPGLSVKRDFTAARERLLAEFPNIHAVVATTARATLLVLYSGREDVDSWLDALRDSVATRHGVVTGRVLSCRGGSPGGDDTAA
jgi:hypothetical protein